ARRYPPHLHGDSATGHKRPVANGRPPAVAAGPVHRRDRQVSHSSLSAQRHLAARESARTDRTTALGGAAGSIGRHPAAVIRVHHQVEGQLSGRRVVCAGRDHHHGLPPFSFVLVGGSFAGAGGDREFV